MRFWGVARTLDRAALDLRRVEHELLPFELSTRATLAWAAAVRLRLRIERLRARESVDSEQAILISRAVTSALDVIDAIPPSATWLARLEHEIACIAEIVETAEGCRDHATKHKRVRIASRVSRREKSA